jgi:pentatricopeptide repeat protein
MIIVSDTTPISELAKVDHLGTVGILLLAKRRGLLDSVKDVLDEMQEQGMRISDRLYVQVLTLAQEKDGE